MSDNDASGDGTTIGTCPSHYGPYNYKCLSNGKCGECGHINGIHEGCDLSSRKPICDEQGSDAQCVACTKSSKSHYMQYTILSTDI